MHITFLSSYTALGFSAMVATFAALPSSPITVASRTIDHTASTRSIGIYTIHLPHRSVDLGYAGAYQYLSALTQGDTSAFVG